VQTSWNFAGYSPWGIQTATTRRAALAISKPYEYSQFVLQSGDNNINININTAADEDGSPTTIHFLGDFDTVNQKMQVQGKFTPALSSWLKNASHIQK
jgi:hypothetical protein